MSDLPAGLQIEADVPAGMGWPDTDSVSIAVKTPTAQDRLVATDYVAPGRLRATLPDTGSGLYTFRGIYVAGYAATPAPAAQQCGERDMGHESGTPRVEK